MLANTKDWNYYWKNNSENFTKTSYSKKRIIHIIENHISYGNVIVDAGCGSGFFSNYFSKKTNIVFAIDYSVSALNKCKQLCNENVIIMNQDLMSDNLANCFDKKIDLIFSDGLLEHFSLNEQKKILSNFYNCLSGKGKLITFVPNKFSPWQIIRPIFMPSIKETPFILRNLIKLHQYVGFRVIDYGGINVLPIKKSPEKTLGKYFGMLLYVICKKD